jgi:2-keto-4-pentenoate hydratase/2-oxohepta-3-ene-1,7-dioic acid hydratase in catechol pathway
VRGEDRLRGGSSLLELVERGELPPEPATDAPLAGARLIAPLRPGKVVAIGLNYLDHIREAGMERPARPLVFANFPSSVIGPGEPIRIDRSLTQRVDWEVELAVVVGRRMRDGDGQWVRGKSLDTFCPLGPVVVTPDELPDPQMLGLRTRVNGETVQDSSTAEMVFGVAELLAFCSRSFTLEPGDVVLTGTPWGCGEFMDPQRSLAGGDVVEVEVDGIGTLRNEVVEESP